MTGPVGDEMTDVNVKVPALEKLLDYVASGIGAVAGPILAKWKARRNAGARVIEAEGRCRHHADPCRCAGGGSTFS